MATEKVIPMTGLVTHDVHADEYGQVDHPTVSISKSAGEQVTWFSHKRAVIAFASPEGSPFEERVFQVPAKGSVSSGPAKPSAEYKAYKYVVVGEIGVNDPTVIINH